MSRLYGRDVLLDDLVPRLVGLDANEPKLLRQAHPDDPPALLLTGPHGSGRTAVLDALARAYQARLPVAEVNCADGGDATAAMVANTSPVVDILTDAACGLCAPITGRKRLRLPRLWTGLAAVSAWTRGDAREQGVAQARMQRLLTECGLADDGDPRAGSWAQDVGALVALGDRSDLAPIADACVRLFSDRYLHRRQARDVQSFYASRLGPGRDAEPLAELCRAFHLGDDLREESEASLAAALLEDLRAHYSGWTHFNQTPRPLLLLDDVHSGHGSRLFGQFLAHRAQGARDPLVLVAAARGDARHRAGPDAAVRTLAQLAGGASGWRRPETGTPSAGVVALELPPLDRGDIVAMLMAGDPPPRPELPRAVRRFTQGSPLGCGLVRDAVAADPRAADLPGHDVGTLRLAGQPVTRRIAARLVPDAELRRGLVLFSVAQDDGAAHALADTFLTSDAQQAAVAAARIHLRTEHGAAADRPFVADPFLRAVLVHELRRRSPAPTEDPPQTWDAVHATLRDHHAGAGDPVAALHHTLALGDADEAVRGLTDLFAPPTTAEEWLRHLWHVASAPHPPRPEWAEECRRIARGAPGTESAGDYVRRCVHRLTHAVWLAADPLTAPDGTLCGRIKWELEQLSGRHVTGAGTLFDAAQEWHDELRELRTPPSALPAQDRGPGPGRSHGESH
ncbi:ATP-binding protein [Streptomyces beihaiensis]|uniref:ATP-binding protein n=1 Tax=Streptomyces beihaiensis TaxID=2984495 RepID=A0ABT3U2C7_9ACTN|nr:ATP-binding protein [Streptomyces beihaiensis]MCX3062757.1 ATP-binding protein [Streptomyces beihaiensis]